MENVTYLKIKKQLNLREDGLICVSDGDCCFHYSFKSEDGKVIAFQNGSVTPVIIYETQEEYFESIKENSFVQEYLNTYHPLKKPEYLIYNCFKLTENLIKIRIYSCYNKPEEIFLISIDNNLNIIDIKQIVYSSSYEESSLFKDNNKDNQEKIEKIKEILIYENYLKNRPFYSDDNLLKWLVEDCSNVSLSKTIKCDSNNQYEEYIVLRKNEEEYGVAIPFEKITEVKETLSNFVLSVSIRNLDKIKLNSIYEHYKGSKYKTLFLTVDIYKREHYIMCEKLDENNRLYIIPLNIFLSYISPPNKEVIYTEDLTIEEEIFDFVMTETELVDFEELTENKEDFIPKFTLIEEGK